MMVTHYLEAANKIHPKLVREAAMGNDQARAVLYQQFSKAMFNICTRMTGNRSDAEDVLHDAFILAFKKLGQLKDPEAFAGWLRQIVVNECIRVCRRVSWQDWEDDHHNNLPEEATEWWSSVNLDLVHREIKGLPDGCRQVFVLYVLENYAHRDIAANLGISEGTSKSQYHRARTLLKERITHQMAIHG